MVVLLLGVFTPVQAQTKDVITFAGGHVDPDNENIYVIDLAPENWIDDEDVVAEKDRLLHFYSDKNRGSHDLLQTRHKKRQSKEGCWGKRGNVRS